MSRRWTRRCLPALGCLLAGSCAQPAASLTSTRAGRPEEAKVARALMPLDAIEPRPEFPKGEAVVEGEPHETPPQAQRYFHTARQRFDQQLWTDAITACERALQIAPRFVDARKLLARAYIEHGNYDRARTQLETALSAAPRDAEVHFLLGQVAFRENRFADGIGSLRLALKATEGGADDADPARRAVAQLLLGLCLKEEGYTAAAAEVLEAYVASALDATPAMHKDRDFKTFLSLYEDRSLAVLAELYSELGRHEKAIEAYQRAADRRPDDESMQRKLVLALARAGRHDEAIQRTRRLLAPDPAGAEGLDLLREVCELSGRADTYDDYLLELARSPVDPQARLALCHRLLDRGRRAAAEEALASLVAAHPDLREAVYLLIDMQLDGSRLADALRQLAAQINDDPESYRRAESVLSKAVERHGAGPLLDAAEALARSAPNDAGVQFLRAELLAEQGGTERALAAVRSILKQDHAFAPAVVLEAQLLIESRQWTEALAVVDRAAEAGLSDAELAFLRGRAHDALDENDKAEAAYLEAFRLDRSDPRPLYRLALAHERREEWLKSEQLYRRILDDVDPRFVPARDRLIRLLVNTGKLDRAKEYDSDFERLKITGADRERCGALIEFAASSPAAGADRLKRYRRALERILEKHPDSAKAHFDLALWYESAAKIEKAKEHAEQALAISPHDEFVRARLAAYHAQLLNFGRAAEAVRELLRDRPNNAAYQRQLVELLLAEGNVVESADRIRTMLERSDAPPASPILIAQVIQALTRSERDDEAVLIATRYWEAQPDDPARRAMYLNALQNADRQDEAVEAARKWLAEDPTNLERRMLFVEQLVDAERTTEALQRLLAWLASDVDDFDLNRALIRVFWAAEDWDSAIEACLTGAEEPSRYQKAYRSMLGATYRLARRFDEAVEFYRSSEGAAATVNPQRVLINVLVEAERFNEAEKEITNVLSPQAVMKEAGRDFDVGTMLQLRQYLANVYQLTGRIQQAIQQLEENYRILEKLRESMPGEGPVHELFVGVNNDLGYTLADAGLDLKRAERMVRFAVGNEPLNGAFLDSLGWLYYKQGDFARAAEYIRRSLLFVPSEDPVLYDHLADALYRLNETDEARRAWEKAAKLSLSRPDRATSPEDRRLNETVQAKLKQLADGQPVDVAPIGEHGATSRPAASSDSAGSDAPSTDSPRTESPTNGPAKDGSPPSELEE